MSKSQRKKSSNSSRSGDLMKTVKSNLGRKAALIDGGDGDPISAIAQKHLPKHTRNYARALVNPFTEPACSIPIPPTVMTQCSKVFVKGSFSTGAAASGGFGFILFDPLRAAANDIYCITYSTNTSILTAATQAIAAGTTQLNSNASYANADFGGATFLSARVVAAGLRWGYIGTELGRGGLVTALQEPNHQSLANTTASMVDSYEESARLPVVRDWNQVLYRPSESTDFDFAEVIPVVGNGTFFMGALVQGPDPTGATAIDLQFEAYSIIEYQGVKARSKTASLSDPVGHDAVQSVMNLAPSLRKPHVGKSETMAKHMEGATAHYVKHATSQAQPRQDRDVGKDVTDIMDSVGTAARVGLDILSFLL